MSARPLSDILRSAEIITAVRPTVAVDPTKLGRSLAEFSDGQYKPLRIETGGRFAARLLGAGVLPLPVASLDRSTVCSLFVTNVLRHATRHNFLAELPLALPADFLTSVEFERQSLRWVMLES